jgi:hypothetical protein
MKFLSAQPDSDYYIWQLEVQYNNFKKFGFEKDMIILMGYEKEKGINPKAKKFAENLKCCVFFISDTREDKTYIPSIRPHIIKKFYRQNKVNEPIFYHDSDIIFKHRFDLNKLLEIGKNKVLVSDTISYIGARYIESKGKKLLNEMCDIVGINKKTVINNERNSGGAQYFFIKELDFMFWEKVERDCVLLYKHMRDTSTKYSPEHPIQFWCSDMWAVLWNLWLFGVDVSIVDEMGFCFATDEIEDKLDICILHNAGVTNNDKHLFNKGEFIDKSPYGMDFSYVNQKYCSYLYVKEIIETGIYNKKL